jgi:hypothetical protein
MQTLELTQGENNTLRSWDLFPRDLSEYNCYKDFGSRMFQRAVDDCCRLRSRMFQELWDIAIDPRTNAKEEIIFKEVGLTR